jgi:uncharacterized phage infection (PIP) family protein YhgE
VPESCEAAHRDLYQRTTDVHYALQSVTRDLEAIQRLLEGVTTVLRDNLVSLSSHDKASSDVRSILLAGIDDLQDRTAKLETDIATLARIQEESRDAQDEFAETLETLAKNRELLLEFVGLKGTLNPVPLARDIQEMVQGIRSLLEKDPTTGRPLAGWAAWYPKIRGVFVMAIAAAALAAAYHVLAPWLSFGKAHQAQRQGTP